MNSQLEKNAENIGTLLGKSTIELGKLVGKYPVQTMGVGAAIGLGGVLLNWANKARGLHQIVNEAGKRDVMDYQTRLLREIAENSNSGEVAYPKVGPGSAGFKQPMPIVPPLR